MPLDPIARQVLDQLAAAPPRTAIPPMQLRQTRRALYAKVEDRTIPGPAGTIPIRLYTPQGSGPFPILMYFHGGGFVIGDLDASDTDCRAISKWAGCLIVSVDYRLAPEHKFPAAVEDAYAATLWAAQNAGTFDGDPSRFAIGGQSAGANLAAVVALLARDRETPRLVYQLLFVPVTDLSNYDTNSWKEFGEGYNWTRDSSQLWANKYYLRDEDDARSPLASPLLAPDVSGLPPALVITAEFDPLRDEGEAYAARLREAGVPVNAHRYSGMIHGFVSSTPLCDQSIETMADLIKALKAAFAARA